MNLDRTLASAVAIAMIGFSPFVADAQEHGNGGRQRGGGRATASQPAQRNDGGRQAAVRQAPREAAPQAAPQGAQARTYNAPQAAPRSYGSQAAPRAYGNQAYGSQAAPRAYGAPQAAARTYGSQQAPRANGAPQAAPRAYGSQAAPRAYGNQGYGAQAAPRKAVPRPPSQYGAPAYGSNGRGYYNGGGYGYGSGYGYGHAAPRYYYARPYYGHVYARPYGWAPYRPYYFGSAYYAFRPWFSIGFGLSIGYPVSYPYTYLGTYQPRVYGYYDQTYPYSVAPSVSVYGGVSFDIQPSDADVFVDGEYVGTVGTFTPYGEPLTLTSGQHRIVVQRDGFRAMEWDVTVEPGQVIPYRGTMQR
jgi:hypothetical protein